MVPGFHRLIGAQFASGLADNALLIVTIASLHAQGRPLWWAPMLKFFFTLSYVLLAPLVGPLADAVPKARLMMWMNGVKVLAVLGLAAGVHPLLAFAVVGLGAAAYAPAKYGLVTELVGPDKLVAANGWIEVSMVCAVLLGTVMGGFLVSDLVRDLTVGPWPVFWLALLAVYAVSAVLNLGIPDSGARYPQRRLGLRALTVDFFQANRTLWTDRLGGLSLAVTTWFWGVGATLQFAVLRWATEVLGLPLERAAYMQAAVALGVVAGATVAGRCVSLGQATRVLPAGVLLGALVPASVFTTSPGAALGLLVVVGAVGGVLVVPMNALLQHRGHSLLTAGRSIAVQNFNENASILVMLGIYALLTAASLPIKGLMTGLGVVVAAVMGLLILTISRARPAGWSAPG